MSNGMNHDHHEPKAEQKQNANVKSKGERKQDQKRKPTKADTSKPVARS